MSIMLICVKGFSAEASTSNTNGSLASRDFEVGKRTEVALEIEARSPGASWSRRGAEAAALLIEVDGVYSQDVLLFAGDRTFVYRVTLGQLQPGKHKVTVKINVDRSAPATRSAIVTSLRPILIGESAQFSEDDLLAVANSPILYQRANTIDRFSDIPLLMYYEIWHTEAQELRVRYTVIFTNEDGGTPAAALMARWGRASDIEWVYEVRFRSGKLLNEIYQAVEHETKRFKGSRTAGSHPLLAVASDNNNFSHLACSAVRFALLPVRANLQTSTRETVMDANAWTYQVMAAELLREGRIKAEPNDLNTISDPRNYLYVDISAVQTGTEISVDVGNENTANVSSSDIGEPRLRIDRSSFFRTAIRLQSRDEVSRVTTVSIQCHAGRAPSPERSCQGVEIKGVYQLDQDYMPRPVILKAAEPQNLRPGEATTYAVIKQN